MTQAKKGTAYYHTVSSGYYDSLIGIYAALHLLHIDTNSSNDEAE